MQGELSEAKRLLAVREGGTQDRLKAVQEENMTLKQQVTCLMKRLGCCFCANHRCIAGGMDGRTGYPTGRVPSPH